MKLRDAKKVLKNLQRKAELVKLGNYEKHFGVVAKSIEGKEDLKLAFDLRDFKVLSTSKRQGNISQPAGIGK